MNRKSFSISLLILALILGFSSCEKEKHDRSFDSSMDVEVSLTTNSDGYFISPTIEYGFYNIKDVNTNKDEVRRIELTGSTLYVYGNFLKGDKFFVDITVDGVGTFKSPEFNVDKNTNEFYIDERNSLGYFKFMEQSFGRMNSTGKFKISFNGVYNVSNATISMKLLNNLKVTVRDK